MNGIGEAALEVQNILEQLGYDFCIIGGLAVTYWGNPRSTQDVDVSLLVPLGQERLTASALLRHLEGRVADAESFAAESRMLLATASNGTPIDIAFAAFPLEQAIIGRAIDCELQPDLSLRLITAEDLVVTKAIANRPQDQIDIRGIIDRQGHHLDRARLLTNLNSFCQLLETEEPLRLVRQLLVDPAADE